MCAQISSCDAILATMEDMLGKFQADLGNISSEIRALQEQSQSMSVRLRNRKAAEARLGAFLENVAIPPALIDGVLLAAPDAGFAVRSAGFTHAAERISHSWQATQIWDLVPYQVQGCSWQRDRSMPCLRRRACLWYPQASQGCSLPVVCVPEGGVCGAMACRTISQDKMSGLACLQEHLLALHKKLEFAKSSEAAAKLAAMQDIAPELERLRAKAVTKSRDILMSRHASAHCHDACCSAGAWEKIVQSTRPDTTMPLCSSRS